MRQDRKSPIRQLFQIENRRRKDLLRMQHIPQNSSAKCGTVQLPQCGEIRLINGRNSSCCQMFQLLRFCIEIFQLPILLFRHRGRLEGKCARQQTVLPACRSGTQHSLMPQMNPVKQAQRNSSWLGHGLCKNGYFRQRITSACSKILAHTQQPLFPVRLRCAEKFSCAS